MRPAHTLPVTPIATAATASMANQTITRPARFMGRQVARPSPFRMSSERNFHPPGHLRYSIAPRAKRPVAECLHLIVPPRRGARRRVRCENCLVGGDGGRRRTKPRTLVLLTVLSRTALALAQFGPDFRHICQKPLRIAIRQRVNVRVNFGRLESWWSKLADEGAQG